MPQQDLFDRVLSCIEACNYDNENDSQISREAAIEKLDSMTNTELLMMLSHFLILPLQVDVMD